VSLGASMTVGLGRRAVRSSTVLLIGALALSPRLALADQGGISFWVPGFFGSFAASPLQPGWSLATVYYHTSVDASGALAAARQVEIGRLRTTANVNLNLNLNGRADLVFLAPTYVFDTKIFGGQFAVTMLAAYGRNSASLDGTLSATIGGLTVTRQGSIADSLTAFGDLVPQANLRWNAGVHNLMIYGTTNIRVGSYDSTRLANTGLGFNAWDGGVGYTYLDPTKGHEFSVTMGVTYNNWNHDTNYKNGIDYHIDFGAAQFLNKQFFVGAVGYAYNQFTADKGAPAFQGDVKSRVYGIGPQLGYLFQAAPGIAGLLALKGYYEFDARDRPEGWNVWLTLNLSPAAQEQKAVSSPRPVWK
jgi:hypothetical protein